jgi:D-glycero-D-manno-heptose 1,7-bisphosphate phosphatase
MRNNPKLVILDRDGVINHDSDAFVKTLSEFIPIAGSIEAIARLSQAGFFIAVASNQSGLARGLVTEQALAEMHQFLLDAVGAAGGKIEMIAFCPHGPDSNCDCRKPKPGLLHAIAAELHIPLDKSVVVGDSYRDLEAAWSVGAAAVLVLTGKGAITFDSHPELAQKLPVFADLASFADHLLKESAKHG